TTVCPLALHDALPISASVVLVIALAAIAIATLGAAGVAFGIAATAFAPRPTWVWHVMGGVLGGMIVGAVVKLLGIDALNLLFGRSEEHTSELQSRENL